MIDVKQAVQAARSYAQDVLGFRVFGVGILPKEYKSFYVDAESGEVHAVKIRELAA